MILVPDAVALILELLQRYPMNDRPDFIKITSLLEKLDEVCRDAQAIRAHLAAVMLPSNVRVERLTASEAVS